MIATRMSSGNALHVICSAVVVLESIGQQHLVGIVNLLYSQSHAMRRASMISSIINVA